MKKLTIGLLLTTLSLSSMARERDFSGDKGNGGDGMIANSITETRHNMRTVIDWEEFENPYNLPQEQTPTHQVYSLDLLDYGLERKEGVSFNLKTNNKDSACIENAGCYQINNTYLFNELIAYESVFGQVIGETFNGARAEFNSTDELNKIYKLHLSHVNKLERFTYNYSGIDREGMLNFLDNIQNRALRSYVKMAKDHHRNARQEFFSEDTLVSIGIINKLEQIKKANPRFAKQLTNKLLELDWLLLNTRLNEIHDEGTIDSDSSQKIQMASRKNGTVKISDLGWNKEIKIGNKVIAPMNATNKVALIFHEVVYEITKKQGDRTSERARRIVAKLFRSSQSLRFINQANNILN